MAQPVQTTRIISSFIKPSLSTLSVSVLGVLPPRIEINYRVARNPRLSPGVYDEYVITAGMN